MVEILKQKQSSKCVVYSDLKLICCFFTDKKDTKQILKTANMIIDWLKLL